MDTPYDKLMDRRTRDEWHRLSQHVLLARTKPNCCEANRELDLALSRETHSPIAPTYGLWLADNFARDGHYERAARAYDAAIERAQTIRDVPARLNPTVGALFSKAKALAIIGDAAAAIETLIDMRQHPSDASSAFFRAGLLAEENGDYQRAADLYASFASRVPSTDADDSAEKCRRALARLTDSTTRYFASASDLTDALSNALTRGDSHGLTQLVSRTHFAVGALGAHTAFEDLKLLEDLGRDLSKSKVKVRRELLGANAKLYLHTKGWRGRWFQRDVFFLMTRAPQGWQWTGIGVSTPNDLWLERWRPEKLETNSPLPFNLLAPWPEGERFMAGGLDTYIAQMAAIQSVGQFAWFMVFMYSGHPCGFGPRGYYYNMWKTHVGAEAFAIDFSRYKRWVPHYNTAGGTPVLAARGGVVSRVRNDIDSNSDTDANLVHVQHADPNNPSDEKRFTSRYLHMQGPFKIPVSQNMPIAAGTRLGLMDDTGTSLFDHLHFSIHDNQIPYQTPTEIWNMGASVRPSPMDGVVLGDRNSGQCVVSTNREVLPLREITKYAVQNWLVFPSAPGVNERFQSPRDQRFMLVLSGVALVDLKGVQGTQWTHETVSIRPPLWDPLNYATGKWQLPTPPSNYTLEFETEQWAPIVTLSSVWNEDVSMNSGFAVDAWRLNPWRTGPDAATNLQLDQLFAGIQVDIAVQDIDAWIFRIGYHITLLGRVAYLPLGNV